MAAPKVFKIIAIAGIASGLAIPGASAQDSEDLPFVAEVLLEDLESYQRDIARKAADAVGRKRAETIARLKSEAAKQQQTGKTAAAAAILREVARLEAEEADRLAAQVAAEKAAAAGDGAQWQAMFAENDLGAKWKFFEEPDGGWSFEEGVLEMTAAKKFAAAIGDVPPGDLVVRAKVKMRAGDGPKEKQAGLGFTTGEPDRTISAIVQAPDLLLGYSGLEGAEGVIGSAKAPTAQRRFIDLQFAWVGETFIVFLNGREAFRKEVGRPRGGGELIAFTNDAQGFYRDIEVREPDAGDRERLLDGRAID